MSLSPKRWEQTLPDGCCGFVPGDFWDVRSALVLPAGVFLSSKQTPARLHVLHALGFYTQSSAGKMRGLVEFSFLAWNYWGRLSRTQAPDVFWCCVLTVHWLLLLVLSVSWPKKIRQRKKYSAQLQKGFRQVKCARVCLCIAGSCVPSLTATCRPPPSQHPWFSSPCRCLTDKKTKKQQQQKKNQCSVRPASAF